MGLLDQFIDVIEYVDDNDKVLVHKYERPGDEIKRGAKVIVREGQQAAFLKGGALADIFGPGTYTLSADNLPLLSTLGAIGYGFNSPLKADLYFINTRQFFENKWGTKNALIMRDEEFGMVRVRAFGAFSFCVNDVALFIREVLAARHIMTTYDVVVYLTSLISEAIAYVLGSTEIPVLDFAAQYRSLSDTLALEANARAAYLGIKFTTVIIENVSMPDEVEHYLDEQTGMGIARQDMDSFTQYQAVRAMRDASQQEGGLAGAGVGFALGNTLVESFSDSSDKTSPQGVAESLRSLKELLDEGVLTQEEFEIEKKKILG